MHPSDKPRLVILQQKQFVTGLDLCPSTQPHCFMQSIPLSEMNVSDRYLLHCLQVLPRDRAHDCQKKPCALWCKT